MNVTFVESSRQQNVSKPYEIYQYTSPLLKLVPNWMQPEPFIEWFAVYNTCLLCSELVVRYDQWASTLLKLVTSCMQPTAVQVCARYRSWKCINQIIHNINQMLPTNYIILFLKWVILSVFPISALSTVDGLLFTSLQKNKNNLIKASVILCFREHNQ